MLGGIESETMERGNMFVRVTFPDHQTRAELLEVVEVEQLLYPVGRSGYGGMIVRIHVSGHSLINDPKGSTLLLVPARDAVDGTEVTVPWP